EPAFASIIESSGHQTHGMLYRLSPSDMARLHTFEGPEYRCIDVPAVGEQAGNVVARAYQTIEPVAGRRPSRRYLRVLCEAARSRQLPTDYIHELEQHPSSYIPVISEIGERCLGLGESVIRFMNQRKSQT
ncbi:MAG: gamma-glutamylcyclotransferase, partial [Myxococcota bacterium]